MNSMPGSIQERFRSPGRRVDVDLVELGGDFQRNAQPHGRPGIRAGRPFSANSTAEEGDKDGARSNAGGILRAYREEPPADAQLVELGAARARDGNDGRIGVLEDRPVFGKSEASVQRRHDGFPEAREQEGIVVEVEMIC